MINLHRWQKSVGAAVAAFIAAGSFGWSATVSAFAARKLPVPPTPSPAIQAEIAKGLPPNWQNVPQTTEEWHKFVAGGAAKAAANCRALREKYGVTMTKTELGGVPVYILAPPTLNRQHKGRVLINYHGGGYVLNPGEAATLEGTLMAALGGYRVISVDYRLAPDHPYPAAIDDAIAVYRAVLKQYPAKKIGVFCASTGGAMSLILPLRARAEGLPLPAAVEAGTPWSDLDRIGDSYFVNEGVDNILVSYDGWLGASAKVYANGHDLKDPMLSPVYGDVTDFPPTMLTSALAISS